MCVNIEANGWGNAKNTHVSVYMYMMRGEFDESLQWPFKGVVKLQLINQRKGGNHFETNLIDEEDSNSKALLRVLEGERSTIGRGQQKFISHSNLYKPEVGKEYLKSDNLKFKVTSIVVGSSNST